jgi:Cdc6-like AAA superfamily ATPase
VRRVPDDVRALAEASADQEARADALELDFIDFLLTYKGNRILSVIGSVGVGKTTFLRYVLQSLRAECASLRPYVPVFINCVALASPHPE